MDTPIYFTPGQVVQFLLALSAFIISLGGSIGIVSKLINKVKSPEQKQNDRITKCEESIKDINDKLLKHKDYFNNDDNRLTKIEDSNRVMQKGMLALLKHSLNGNDIGSLRAAEKELEQHLIGKTLEH